MTSNPTSNLIADLRNLHSEIVDSDGHESEMMALVRRGFEEIERLVHENQSLRNLAANLRPGPISQALQDSPDYSGQTIERLRMGLESLKQYRNNKGEYVATIEMCAYIDQLISGDSSAPETKATVELAADTIRALMERHNFRHPLMSELGDLIRETFRMGVDAGRCYHSPQETKSNRERGWLVEDRGGHARPHYRTMDQARIHWTDDANKAIRFARRADAEMFAAGDEDAWRITEHEWVTVDGDTVHVNPSAQETTVPHVADLATGKHPDWCRGCAAEKASEEITPPHPGPSIEKAFARSPRVVSEKTSGDRCHFTAFRDPQFRCNKPAGHTDEHSCGLAPTTEPSQKASEQECRSAGPSGNAAGTGPVDTRAEARLSRREVTAQKASADCTGCGGKPEFPNIPCSICGRYPDGTSV